jgi:hypothetical protein
MKRRIAHIWKTARHKGKALAAWAKRAPNWKARRKRVRALRDFARQHQLVNTGSRRVLFYKFYRWFRSWARRITRHHPPAPKHQTYGAGGWAPPGPWRLQRVDQGQDFEIPSGDWIVAPGRGVVVGHLSDAAWPGGFGSPYLLVRIDEGAFAIGDRLWYVGHCGNSPAGILPVGHAFQAGDKLAQTSHGLNWGWGWCELGKATGGGPGPMGTGAAYAHLFTNVSR